MSVTTSVTGAFVETADAGIPVWTSAVREAYAALPEDESWRLRIAVAPIVGPDRAYDLRLPLADGLAAAERDFVTEYVLASMYNILSTVGGRRVDFIAEGDDGFAADLTAAFDSAFGIGLSRKDRRGQGRCVNVIERMLHAVPEGGGDPFTWTLTCRPLTEPLPAAAAARRDGVLDACRDALADLDARTILGIDVGGTDIRAVLCVGGVPTAYTELDWFPAGFTRMDEMLDAITGVVRLMRLEAVRQADPHAAVALDDLLVPALADAATPVATILETVARGESLVEAEAVRFDAIGMCFPDVVVRDKIVGGEVYKTRGMRENPDIDYEAEFLRLTDLDTVLAQWVRPGGVVGIVNDGPMGAFTAAVEMAAVDPARVRDGVFAHTLGTELGTGWLTDAGEIPDIPLEVYNCVIDLGDHPERAFPADDVRSVMNFNTGIAGTLQKYTSQAGVFRLAAKHFPVHAPERFTEFVDLGLLVAGPDGWHVPTAPVDRRKPFLEHVMQLALDGDPVAARVFREEGEFLAAAWLETTWILDPAATERVIFGKSSCFDLVIEGARSLVPGVELIAADDNLAETPLMRALRDDPARPTTHFAQAVGAVHYANLRLHRSLAPERDQP